MSTLSQFYGGGIKSIQRGTLQNPGGDATQNVTISSVNMAKSVVLSNARWSSSGTAYAAGGCQATLTSSTNVALSFGITSSDNRPEIVSWQVVEYM